MKYTPRAHQKRATKWLLDLAQAALFLEPGLGKTAATLDAIVTLRKDYPHLKTLVIAPLAVAYNVWPAEVEKWSKFNGLRVTVLHGPKKEKLLHEDSDVYVVNPEGLRWLFGARQVVQRGFAGATKKWLINHDRVAELGFDVLVIDELSKFKNGTTARFKILEQAQKTFLRVWGLTGSPSPRSLLNLHSQVKLLDGGHALGRYYSHYRSTYFYPVDEYTWLLKPEADKLITAKLKNLAISMRAAEYVKLPEMLEQDIVCELPEACRAQYDEFVEEMWTQLGDDELTAFNAATVSSKCRQFTGGAVYIGALPDERHVAVAHDVKIQALKDLVEELQGKQLLVAYDFVHEKDRVQSVLEHVLNCDVPFIGSGVTAAKTKAILKAWNEGGLPVLLAHPAAIGHGVNAQQSHAAHVCWFTPTWDYELYDQFNRRVYRQGNEAERVIVHRLVMKNTVDVKVLASLKKKESTQTALMNALRALRS